MEYTEEIHVRRLKKLLNLENPCDMTTKPSCPAEKDLKWKYDNIKTIERRGQRIFEYRVDGYKNSPCNVCCGFISMMNKGVCPCRELGKHEAIKRTWLALEEKGYLDEISL